MYSFLQKNALTHDDSLIIRKAEIVTDLFYIGFFLKKNKVFEILLVRNKAIYKQELAEAVQRIPSKSKPYLIPILFMCSLLPLLLCSTESWYLDLLHYPSAVHLHVVTAGTEFLQTWQSGSCSFHPLIDKFDLI